MPAALRALAEQAVTADRFRMALLVASATPVVAESPETGDSWRSVVASLEGDASRTLAALIRTCYLIEPVNAAITSTKFAVRWGAQLPFAPTRATFEECDLAFETLLHDLAGQGADSAEVQTLGRFLRSPALPYEIPVDYRVRDANTIHTAKNLFWVWNEPEIAETVALRELLRTPAIAGDEAEAIALAFSKIRVKTYLTDRALTGAHKTNREKRWETHPNSVQFAFRRECLKIEHRLLLQLCSFRGFPDALRASLTANGLVIPAGAYRDPITLDELSYEAFKSSIENPVWGKDPFQVGHLNPLKADSVPGTAGGHTAVNIGWISDDGNRIQGSLNLDEVRSLLARIARNYEDLGVG